jgi:hypothetical protein
MVEDDDELLHIRMLPEPTLTFTLPSVHDGTTLDCRVFHPLSLDVSPNSPPWQRNAAIVAHPYAPLGGSYDDPIVDLVASTLLRLGYLVCTFNFRYFTLPISDIAVARRADIEKEERLILRDAHHGPAKLSVQTTCLS